MQAIRTRYHGPTNTKGSRISAKAEAKMMYFGYDHALPGRENHEAAAYAYARSLGWIGGDDNLLRGEFAGDQFWVLQESC